jgi:hypothetical protein
LGFLDLQVLHDVVAQVLFPVVTQPRRPGVVLVWSSPNVMESLHPHQVELFRKPARLVGVLCLAPTAVSSHRGTIPVDTGVTDCSDSGQKLPSQPLNSNFPEMVRPLHL